MNRMTHIAIAGALLLGVSGLVLAQGTAPSSAQHSMHEAKKDDAASTVDFKKAHAKMMRDMEIKYSNKPDVDFVRGMIPHHQGAIDMAKVQLAHGKDPAIRAMAEKIIADQEKEIGQMQEWLKKNAK